MTKRFLRLKEHQPSQTGAWTTTQDYLNRTDGSLSEGKYEYETLPGGFLGTGTEHSSELPTVFMVGDSFVESSFSSPELRFASQIDSGITTHNIVNSGYSGTTTLQAVLLILGKLPAYAQENDTVLLFIPKSDANTLPLDGGYWNSSRTYSPIVPNDFETSWKASSADLKSLLNALAAFLEGIGLKLLFATSPHRNGDFSSDGWLRLAYRRNRAVYDKRVELRKSLDEQVRGIASDLDVPLLDLSKMYSDRSELFYDELHLNNSGQIEVAGSISEFIKNHL